MSLLKQRPSVQAFRASIAITEATALYWGFGHYRGILVVLSRILGPAGPLIAGTVATAAVIDMAFLFARRQAGNPAWRLRDYVLRWISFAMFLSFLTGVFFSIMALRYPGVYSHARGLAALGTALFGAALMGWWLVKLGDPPNRDTPQDNLDPCHEPDNQEEPQASTAPPPTA